MKKPCPFNESLLAQMGWSEQDYIEFYGNYINFKLSNDLRLTLAETSFWINNSDEYFKLKENKTL